MVTAMGTKVISIFDAIGEVSYLILKTMVALFTPPFRFKDFVKQLNFVAVESAPVVVFCVSFAAMVTIIEASFHMKMVIQNDAMVPGFSSLLIIRELGAVITALLVTSRVGAGLAAEVGTMQITEQIDALKMLGIEKIRYLVVPRFLACVIAGFTLTIIANLVCLYCAMLVSQFKLGYTFGNFLVGMRTFVQFQDLVFSSIKGACFGAVIPIVSCYYGFKCKAGAEGVGLATTNSVVTSSVSILILDFLLSWIFSFFY